MNAMESYVCNLCKIQTHLWQYFVPYLQNSHSPVQTIK